MSDMLDVIRPTTEDEVRDVVASALASSTVLDIVGGGTKRALGRAVEPARRLEVSGLAGISLYEPDELVLSAAAGTPLAEIEGQLANAGQEFAFEPPDWRALLGAGDGEPTIGGTIACNLSGPRRIKAGAARDHVLGVRVVSGRGEVFKSGGRVVKNVTGYDMSKLLAGSYGTLGVMTEITLKVLPAADKIRTVLVVGLDDGSAVAALTRALHSPNDVSAAAHLPAAAAAHSSVSYVRDAGSSVTAVRIEGSDASVAARCAAIKSDLGEFGEIDELHRHNSAVLWREIGSVASFAGDQDRDVWRVSVPPASGVGIAEAAGREHDTLAFYDWGGGLVWLAVASDHERAASTVRKAVGECGGHATLVRAPASRRANIGVFQPQSGPVAALSRRLKQGFDPNGILNPGRLYDGM